MFVLCWPTLLTSAIVRSRPAVFEGPVELVKIIFDTAARDEKTTAATLVRVCRTSREWAIPILYEDVELSSNPSATRFQRMLEMQSSSTLAGSVKSLRGSSLPNAELLSRRCHAIEAMTLQNYDVQQLNHLAMPCLTHVTIAGSLRYVRFTPGKMPGLANVTHLRFPNDVPRLPEDFIRGCVPQLSHFSCCYQLPVKKNKYGAASSSPSRHDELERCLETVLRAPGLRVVVVYVNTKDGKEGAAVARAIMGSIGDPRVVVASAAELPDEAQNLSPRYDAGWVLGEGKLRTRRTAGNIRC